MSVAPVNLYVDSQQARVGVAQARTALLHQGGYPAVGGGYTSGWDDQAWNNVTIDPVTYMAFITPYCYMPSWSTQNYSRLQLSDFGLSSGTDGWGYNCVDFNGQYRLYNQGGMASAAVTSSTYGQNRAFFISYYSFGTPDSLGNDIDFGWGGNTILTCTIGCRVYTDGKVEIYQNGNIVGGGSLKTIANHPAMQSQGQNNNQGVKIFVMPCRQRELLILSNLGGGFNWVFDSIDPTNPNPVIIPDAPFWFVKYGSVDVEVAPSTNPTSGWICSKTLAFSSVPNANTFSPSIPDGNVFYHPAFDGSSDSDQTVTAMVATNNTEGTSVYTPPSSWSSGDNTSLQCQIFYTLTDSTGNYTPFLYASTCEVTATPAYTAQGNGVDLIAYKHTMACSLEVPDSPAGVAVHVDLLNPTAIQNAPYNVPAFVYQTNRPFGLQCNGVGIVDGIGGAPSNVAAAVNDGDRWSIEIRDFWKRLEQYVFTDPMPLDGLTLVQAFTQILNAVFGVGAIQISVSTVSFSIDAQPACSTGEFTALIESGDKASEWVTRLITDYAATWYYGFYPTPGGVGFYAWQPSDFYNTGITVYDTNESAGGYELVVRSIKVDYLEPEANDIFVMGWDPGIEQPIAAWYPDFASQDPTTPPGSRPGNWVGEKRTYGLFEPSLTTQKSVNQAATLLNARLNQIYTLVEIECDMLFNTNGTPVWRGQEITLSSSIISGLFVVKAFHTDFIKEPNASNNDSWFWRPTRYTLEYAGVMT